MNPKIEFRHVLGELSVNRNDPCEILRELISNSYDARAERILLAPLDDLEGFIFLDDGEGLSATEQKNGITPWEAFFSIGKSTKNKGDGIGYKCQGSKLCFASNRILVASKTNKDSKNWIWKVVENPRSNLDTTFDIAPETTADIKKIIDKFLGTPDTATASALKQLNTSLDSLSDKTGTLIIIDGLDTENFGKYFSANPIIEDSYVFNYIRFCTRQGDVRKITAAQGFSPAQVTQIAAPSEAIMHLYSAPQGMIQVPFGFPYLKKNDAKEEIKTPLQISRLRDGRFFARSAKSFSVGGKKYQIIFAIDGNRRAHDEYTSLDRKGKTKSGIRLSDHRGAFVSVKGIKICKYADVLANIEEYSVLAEGDSVNHYLMVLEGDFDLVTNRNALSKTAYDNLSDPEFVKKVKEFLDSFRSKESVFNELIARLRRESSENLLNEQIELLSNSKNELKQRERVRISDLSGRKHLILAPLAGEEYLVGVLYATLAKFVPNDSTYAGFWRHIVTFSTQGIDSLALKDPHASAPLNPSNVESVEYKYEFNNQGPFNHAIAVVDTIVAWDVNIDPEKLVKDTYTCHGKVETENAGLSWKISEIENDEASEFPDPTIVISLRALIERTFGVKFSSP